MLHGALCISPHVSDANDDPQQLRGINHVGHTTPSNPKPLGPMSRTTCLTGLFPGRFASWRRNGQPQSADPTAETIIERWIPGGV